MLAKALLATTAGLAVFGLMDECEATKMLLGHLSETSLRTLHDTLKQLIADDATPAPDKLALSKHLAGVARLLSEK